MTFARLDDQLAWHAKVLDAGNEAFGAWVRMVAHASAQLTDGRITAATARLITTQDCLDALMRARLLERDGDGYQIHDFLDWNPSAEEVRAKREAVSAKRSEVGRKGAIARWNPDGKPDGKTDPFAMTLPSTRNGKTMAPSHPTPSHPIPDQEGDRASARALPPERASRPADPMGDSGLAAAWLEGARAGGAKASRPVGGLVKHLLAAVEAHAPESTRAPSAHAEREAWVRESAERWARSGPSSPKLFAWTDWLAAGERAPPARGSRPRVQPVSDAWAPPEETHL